MSDATEGRALDVSWPETTDLPLLFVNQMAAYLGASAGPEGIPDSVELIFGLASMPLLIGSEESVQRRLEEVENISVVPVTRLAMSRERAEELLQVLSTTLARYDDIVRQRRRART